MNEKTESRDNRSADRTLAILEAFSERKGPMTLRELAECCDIPVSTCHSLVHTLLNRSYLYQTRRRRDLYPTRRILDLAVSIVAHDPYLERLAPYLESLRATTEETIILGKRHRDQILYLEVLEGPQTIRYSARPGELKPLHSTCIGKTILGSLPVADLRAWLKSRPLPRVTGNTLTTQARLVADLAESARRGYYLTVGENVADVTAVAVPVHLNNEVLGIAIAGPSHRMGPRIDSHARRLFELLNSLRDCNIASA